MNTVVDKGSPRINHPSTWNLLDKNPSAASLLWIFRTAIFVKLTIFLGNFNPRMDLKLLLWNLIKMNDVIIFLYYINKIHMIFNVSVWGFDWKNSDYSVFEATVISKYMSFKSCACAFLNGIATWSFSCILEKVVIKDVMFHVPRMQCCDYMLPGMS